MKIKKVECERFAGLRDQEIEFEDGLNLVIGDNETGKSTIVELIYQLLFHDAKIDGRSDREFIEKYFPNRTGEHQEEEIDGVLKFETEQGTCRIRKEWDKGEGTVKLYLPDDTILKNAKKIKEILKEELKHREGVYSEIVFASRKRPQIVVESIMKELSQKGASEFKDLREDLASTLTQAAMETGGVSIDMLEKKLEERILSLSQNWDLSLDLPNGGMKHGIRNPWKRGVGEILKAYYAMENVRQAQREAEAAELAVENLNAGRSELKKERNALLETQRQFQKYRGILTRVSNNKKLLGRLDDSIRMQENDLAQWPETAKRLEQAKDLRTQAENAHIRELYLQVKAVREQLTEAKIKRESLAAVDMQDVKRLDRLQQDRARAEAALSGLNLIARIRKTGSSKIEIRSVASGMVTEVEDAEVPVKEAVEIVIPGIMEMQLAPQDVNLEEVKNRLQETGTEIREIFEHYGVDSLEALTLMGEAYQKINSEIMILEEKEERVSKGRTWEELCEENKKIPERAATEQEISRLVMQLCGSSRLDSFIGLQEGRLEYYQDQYETIGKLREKLQQNRQEREKLLAENRLEEEIPEAYRFISDPEEYNEQLDREIKEKEREMETILANIQDAERKLGERSAEEFADDLEEREKIFEEKKEELHHWLHMRQVFREMKETMDENPLEDIEHNFKKYLEQITGGTLVLQSMDDKMSVNLVSGSSQLTWPTLSEGTKETVSLAFRLAMLEHLFPEGGGMAVFDDPFTEMDPKRVQQACKLVEQFAEQNQVIFVTCDSKYKELLDGHVISLQSS